MRMSRVSKDSPLETQAEMLFSPLFWLSRAFATASTEQGALRKSQAMPHATVTPRQYARLGELTLDAEMWWLVAVP